MADYYVTSEEDPHVSSGNAGTIGDPMGLQEAISTFSVGDTVFIMDDGSYSLTTQINVSGSGTATTLKKVFGTNSSGVEDGSKPTIGILSGNNFCFDDDPGGAAFYHFKNLILNDLNRAGVQGVDNSVFEDLETSSAESRAIVEACRHSVLLRCKSENGDYVLLGAFDSFHLIDCLKLGGVGLVKVNNSSRRGLFIHNCVADGCSGSGVTLPQNTQSGVTISNSLFMNCTGSGIQITAENNSGHAQISNCICFNNGGSGITTQSSTKTSQMYLLLDNNICVSNGGYGYEWLGEQRVVSHDNYGYNNTSGLTNGVSALSEQVEALTSNPFVDSASDDFFVNDTAGGGAVIRDILRSNPLNPAQSSYAFRRLVETLGGSPVTRATWG